MQFKLLILSTLTSISLISASPTNMGSIIHKRDISYVNCPSGSTEKHHDYVINGETFKTAVCCPCGDPSYIGQPTTDNPYGILFCGGGDCGSGDAPQIADLHQACVNGAYVWAEHPRACGYGIVL